MSKTIKIEAKNTPDMMEDEKIKQKNGPASVQSGSTLNKFHRSNSIDYTIL